MRKDECVVIIPAYEPSANFIDYAKELTSADIAQLVVINDGSGEKYDHIFNAIRELNNCTVISYEKNGGKGFALKTAFKYCKENYDERFTFVTADCDGQHIVSDVLNVASAASEFGDSFILGVRDFSQDNVPKRSRSGNVFTRRMFRVLYGAKISDTQTGLRAFPYSMLDTLLAVGGGRFEYEMNQLVVLHKMDVPIREVPITTVYEAKPDDVETVSHYQTFKDSMRVAKVLFTNLSVFFVASIASAIIELTLQYLGLRLLPEDGIWIFSTAVCAQFVARLCSSIVNFSVNYKFVFNGHSKRSIFRYYVLWAALFATSIGFSSLFSQLVSSPELVVLLTGLSTICMSLVSYQVQTRWVFSKGRHKDGKFWGNYARFARWSYNLFSTRYTSLVARDPVGAVYVCRHLNMHGPYTASARIGFDVHLMVFSVFCSYKECFTHFRDYNFMTLKKMNKFSATISAFFVTLFLVPLIRSFEGIPVYRKNTQSITTLRRAIDCLEKHENVIIFPDISYTADSKTGTDIYSGFLFLEKMYYKKFNKHLRFIPIVIDDENRTIIEKPPVRFKNGDYKSQVDGVKEQIMRAMGCVVGDETSPEDATQTTTENSTNTAQTTTETATEVATKPQQAESDMADGANS